MKKLLCCPDFAMCMVSACSLFLFLQMPTSDYIAAVKAYQAADRRERSRLHGSGRCLLQECKGKGRRRQRRDPEGRQGCPGEGRCRVSGRDRRRQGRSV